ncbi:MBOAT family O-acyltransferase [uncultured Croceitalea sp.]|uniref:MBOAT family O-acyltransferase n=1 Tax=uncultured Croceitalea sp. TaxID=1798908 RepID=UPI00374E51E9
MIASICVNYLVGLLIQKIVNKRISTLVLTIGITINLSILIYFKYANFILENLNNINMDIGWDLKEVALPIGVSFFTFQNISYLIDVYRKEVKAQKNLIHLGLYISLFPQLIAGPIVRYIDIQKEIIERRISKVLFKEGIRRFIRGLGKKVIIANTSALIGDKIFNIAPDDISTPVAWLGIICYSLQIYFDFSGYSDMAIGLGKMLGFNFKENFNYPYVAKSIQDFWRRWHISLSTWFRDYLYIPLGGNRKGQLRTYLNLIIVFFITGLWHGASWNFVIWGLFHGLFLLLERNIKIRIPKNLDFIKHIYLLFIVLIGWVFFRIEDFSQALLFLRKMFSFTKGTDYSPLMYMDSYSTIVILVGFILATPIRKLISNKYNGIIKMGIFNTFFRDAFYLIFFIFTIMELAQSTYNPFIYFRF